MSHPEDCDLVAPEGQVWVCGACGKTSKHMYGSPGHGKVSYGWDESCMLNAVLCHEEKNDDGQWVAVPRSE